MRYSAMVRTCVTAICVFALCAAFSIPAPATTPTGHVSIGGKVFLDSDCNGALNPGEGAVGGLTVDLLGQNGNVLDTTKTSFLWGQYQFTDLAPGTYTVRLTPPAQFHVSGTTSPVGTTSLSSSPNEIEVKATTGGRGYNQNRFFICFNGPFQQFTTFTASGYGTPSMHNTGSAILTQKFSQVYPNGITIGCAAHSLTFTTAQAVISFLPAHGKAGSISSSATNPTTTTAGRLAGEVLALQINADLSKAGAIPSGLGGMIVTIGPFAGMTLDQAVAAANNALCGDMSGLPAGVTPAEVTLGLAQLNASFNAGMDHGILVPPPSP